MGRSARPEAEGCMASKFDSDRVARIPVPKRKPSIVPALQILRDEVLAVCPPEATVSFRFDGKLYVDIDIRSMEHVTLVESFLPTLRAGGFHDIRRGRAPSAFLHRIVAEVDC